MPTNYRIPKRKAVPQSPSSPTEPLTLQRAESILTALFEDYELVTADIRDDGVMEMHFQRNDEHYRVLQKYRVLLGTKHDSRCSALL